MIRRADGARVQPTANHFIVLQRNRENQTNKQREIVNGYLSPSFFFEVIKERAKERARTSF